MNFKTMFQHTDDVDDFMRGCETLRATCSIEVGFEFFERYNNQLEIFTSREMNI